MRGPAQRGGQRAGAPPEPTLPTVVWLSPSATSYACLCETCLDASRASAFSFLEAVRVSVVRGTLSPGCEFVRARCGQGHELIVRRGRRPASLNRVDERQLQLT